MVSVKSHMEDALRGLSNARAIIEEHAEQFSDEALNSILDECEIAATQARVVGVLAMAEKLRRLGV